MGATRKIKNDDLLNAIKGAGITPTPQAGTPAGEKDEKIKITFFCNKSTKELLQNYCDNHDMTLTAGIKKAIREMLDNNTL